MKRDFKNKNVLITGAAGNLGTSLCLKFADAGCNIYAIDLNQETVSSVCSMLQENGYSASGFACDITNKEKLEQLIRKIQTELSIDILINNAGITNIQKFEDILEPETVLRRLMEVNLFAPVLLTKYCLNDLINNKGLIINISSVAGFAPLLGRTAYSSSKHALQGYFESLRTELYDKGVHCLTACPSFIAADADRAANEAEHKNSVNQKKKLIGKALDPNMVAEKILKAAQKNQNTVIIGKTAKMSYFMFRFFPSIYERMMRKKLSKGL